MTLKNFEDPPRQLDQRRGERLEGSAARRAWSAVDQPQEFVVQCWPVGIDAPFNTQREHLCDVAARERDLLAQRIENMSLLDSASGEFRKVVDSRHERAEVEPECQLDVAACCAPSVAFAIWAIPTLDKTRFHKSGNMPT